MSTDSGLLFAQVACLLIVGSVADWENLRPSHGLPTARTLPAGYNNYPDIGTAYKFIRDRETWSEAKRICASDGGRLPIIDGTLKLARLTSVAESASDVWIGLKRNGSQWRAVDGSSPAYIPWGSDQPDSHGDCAVLKVRSRGVHNSHCGWLQYFICEIITGATSNGGSSHLYPDLRQLSNPSHGNWTHGNPWQRNPPYNGQPSNWNNSPHGNPAERNPPYNGQPSNWNNHHPAQRYPAGHPTYGNNPGYGNSSYNNPSHGGNPTQRNPPFGHPSYGNNTSWGIHTTGNPHYLGGPSYDSSTPRNPYLGGPSYGSPTPRNPYLGGPSYGSPTPRNPWYGNPSYVTQSPLNPPYGNPSHGNPSYVTPSSGDSYYRNPSHGNSSTGYRGR